MDTRNKIHRAGQVINVLCIVVRVFLILNASVGFVGSVVFFTGIDIPTDVFSDATENAIFGLLSYGQLLKDIPTDYVLAIQALTFGVIQVFLLRILHVFQQLVSDLSQDEVPFDVSTAQRLRHSLWQIAVLAFWNPLFAALIFIFALLVSYLIEYGAYLQEKADETNRVQEQLIVQFAEITENKSGQTGQHIKRVSEYARILASEMGLPTDQVEMIRLASTMHDIGKLLVPTEILEKPARLTDEEYAIIKQHTTYGGQLLNNVDGDVMHLSRTIALDHHERWDGRGYAQGKRESEISLEGRIVAVADVYDALTSRRSYKEAWDDREAYDEIVRCSGTQFDPQVVEAFCRRYDEINQVRKNFQD